MVQKIILVLLPILLISCSKDDEPVTAQNSSPNVIGETTANNKKDLNEAAMLGNYDWSNSDRLPLEWEWKYPRLPIIQPNEIKMKFVNSVGEPTILKLGVAVYEAKNKPWSSWWYPFAGRELVDGFKNISRSDSVLVKYDRFVERRFSQDSRAVEHHSRFRFNPNGAHWVGLCNARAYASILRAEPLRNARVEEICFSVEDQKALLSFMYETLDANDWNGWYGQRNDASISDIFADIYPDQFHQFLLQELRDRQSAFIMDHDPAKAVWTDVVYAARIDVKRVQERNDAVDVYTIVRTPDYTLTPDQLRASYSNPIGTLAVSRVYNYRLFGKWQGEEFLAYAGYWTKGSEIDHPDYLVKLPSRDELKSLEHGSLNPYLDVKKISTLLDQLKSAPSCDPIN